jgi:hypothetical protein
MLASYATRHVVRNRTFAAVLCATLALVLAAARVDTSAASVTFADGIQASGSVGCVSSEWPVVRHFSIYFNAYQAAYNTSIPPTPYAPTYVLWRVVQVATGQIAISTNSWVEFHGATGIWTVGPLDDGLYSVQAYYGRYINGVWHHSINWEQVKVIGYQARTCYHLFG